ncbi:neuropeptide receptor 15 [Patella vulgata]|uniref:neuropeptide receptor 15 n=1 Tax=Patella vulgata TaxID=6465 RepID=UPI002180669C|nr:neuropeptide receptor 15 [Patella vulgata]
MDGLVDGGLSGDSHSVLALTSQAINLTLNLPLANNRTPEVEENPMVSTSYIAIFSTLFCVVGFVGIIGNFMVIYIILADRKMRKSVTNMLILNLAIADSIIMLFGVPEIVLFMLNRGWLMGLVMCKLQRTLLVCGLYSSVLTLVAVCVERYIAIVFPIRAHLLCTKKRTFVVIVIIWFLSLWCGIPTAMFNTVAPPARNVTVEFCTTQFPHNPAEYMKLFKFSESVFFYFGPLLVQLVCYIVIGKRLFVGVELLHRNATVRCRNGTNHNSRNRERTSEAIRARKGVVKMLIASVIIYFLSYSPHQILLFYNTFSQHPFHHSWLLVVITNTLAYINSAANPILYCVFSENFRLKFRKLLRCVTCWKDDLDRSRVISMASYTEHTTLLLRRSVRRGVPPSAV